MAPAADSRRMTTICRAFQTQDEAGAAVERLLAGDAAQQRSGGFGDLDRETVTSYDDGVKRVHVASHRDVRRLLVDAGLDPDAAADDVEALHRGRVLVLVRTSAVEDAAAVLDGVAR